MFHKRTTINFADLDIVTNVLLSILGQMVTNIYSAEVMGCWEESGSEIWGNGSSGEPWGAFGVGSFSVNLNILKQYKNVTNILQYVLPKCFQLIIYTLH